MKIQALQEVFQRANQKIDFSNLASLDWSIENIPEPIKADIEEMVGEIILAHENNPVIAFGFVSALIGGCVATLKYIDLES